MVEEKGGVGRRPSKSILEVTSVGFDDEVVGYRVQVRDPVLSKSLKR